MTLEAAIAENTSAIRELIAALANGTPTTAAQVEKVVKEAKPAKATVATNGASSTQEPSSPLAAAAAPEPAPAAETPQPGAASVTYEEVKKAIFALAGKKGRDAVVATLKTFGAEKGTDLKPAQYADFLKAAA